MRGEVEQCLENVRAVLLAAAMDYENVVSVYVFLEDLNHYEVMNEVFREKFPENPPVRSTLQAGKIPGRSRIEIQVIAVQDGTPKKLYGPPRDWINTDWWPFNAAVEVNGRLYLSGMGTADNRKGGHADHDRLRIKQSLISIGEMLALAGLDFRHVVFTNPYLGPSQRDWENLNTVWRQFFEFGNTPARATLTMARVPGDDVCEISAVAVTDLNLREVIRPINRRPSPTASPAVMAGDVLYTSGLSGFMPGQGYITEDFEAEMRFSMRNIQDCLEAAAMTFENIVNVNAYLGDMDDYSELNRIYREYFPDGAVARTTIQQSATSPDNRPRVQFTAIAHRSVTQRSPGDPIREKR
jgi:enamine deaminase RidA (YjgF/YER057c/UK114 family)